MIGGSAVNRLSAEALGLTYPTYGAASMIPENKGMVKLIENAFGGTNVAMIVAGWTADNTRDATAVLKDYATYQAAGTLTGDEVEVSSAAGVITVGPPTAAPTE